MNIHRLVGVFLSGAILAGMIRRTIEYWKDSSPGKRIAIIVGTAAAACLFAFLTSRFID